MSVLSVHFPETTFIRLKALAGLTAADLCLIYDKWITFFVLLAIAIALAKQYFNFLEDDLLKAYVQDGRAFIENVQKPYDLIFLDAYTAAGIPKHLATKEFLLSLKKALKPSGAIIANMWSTPKVNPLYRSMLRTYQEVFHEVYTLRVPTAGNKIVIALPQFRGLPLNSIAQRAQEISVQKRLPFELSEVLQPGLIKLIDLQENPVLLDGDQ